MSAANPAAHASQNARPGPVELTLPLGRMSTADAKSAQAHKAAQEEFGFGEMESRGYFEKTDRNLFDGQDLDVPTYLRKGIKIVI